MDQLDPSDQAPRVLRVVTRLNVGGPARHALLLTKALTAYPTVLATGTPPAHEGEMNDPKVDVVRVPLVRPVRPLDDARAFMALRRLVREVRPDIVHTHMAKAGTLGRLATDVLKPRPVVVHTFHGHVLEGYFRPVVQRAFIAAERRLARRTDALIAVSREVADELLDLGIGSPERMHVIPLGLDISSMLAVREPSGQLRARLGLGPDSPLIGIAARLAPIKDHATVLRAMQRLPGVHLAVLGDGELRESLSQQIDRLGLADRVHLVGWWSDMAAAYSDLDVAVLTSRNEGTPVALIEAFAAGVPAVATDVGGVRSVVLDGQTGVLVPPADPQGVAAAVQMLLDDPEKRRVMGERGRSHVRDRFGHERLIRDISALYRVLLEQHS